MTDASNEDIERRARAMWNVPDPKQPQAAQPKPKGPRDRPHVEVTIEREDGWTFYVFTHVSFIERLPIRAIRNKEEAGRFAGELRTKGLTVIWK